MKKFGGLKLNYLINSIRKYADLGDWLYFRLMFTNAGEMIKAALSDRKEKDKLLYDRNDNRSHLRTNIPTATITNNIMAP